MLSINPNALADAIVSQLKSLGIAVETNPQPQPTAQPSAPKPAQGQISTKALENAAAALFNRKNELADAQNEVDEAEETVKYEFDIIVEQLKARGVSLPEGAAVMVLDGSGVLTTAQV